MPAIILNVSGTTRTTGTANPVISGTTGKSGPFSDLANNTEVAYVRRYSNNKAGFENCIGIWKSATNTIERTSVEKSSNDGDPVVWGVGEQTIDATITPDMIVADDDPRLDTVDSGDMDAATSIDGDEGIIADQDGDGVIITPSQILGTPFLQKSGHGAVTRIREYSDFTRIRPAFTSSDGGTLDLEPYLVNQGGTGAKASQVGALGLSPPSTGRPGLLLNTGTDTTGYTVVQHLWGPMLYANGASSFDQRAEIKMVDLPTAGEDYLFAFGFFVLGVAPATTQFIGLVAARSLGSNWAQMVKNSGGQTTPGTSGVPIQTSANTVLRVWYDPATTKTRFYIDGVELPSISDATRAMDLFSLVRPGFIIQKIAGTTNRTVVVWRHSIDVLGLAAPNFA